ncbi:unnamed protein product, partial [Tilletia caries]
MSPSKERRSALDAMESTSDSGADTDTSEARASVRTKAPLALKPASVFARRVSARIQENHIQPAPEKQTVVTGVGRNPAAKELPAPKEAPASPAKRAAAAAKTGAKSAPRPLQALERRIQAALSQRDEKEAALRGFFETLTTGLRNIEGLNALDSDRVESIGTLLSLAAGVAFAQPGRTPVCPEWHSLLANADLSKLPAQSGVPLTAADATTALDTSAWPLPSASRLTRSSKPSSSPANAARPVLAPLQGYRTQGGTKGDAAKLAAAGGSKENRTFIRLSDGNKARDEDPFEIRLRLEKLLASLNPLLTIGRVKAIKSGFSFTPGVSCNARAFEPYFSQIQKAFDAKDVEGPCQYRQFCLRGLPAKIVSGGAPKAVTPHDVQVQVCARFPGIKLATQPRILTPARHESPAPLWLISVAEGEFSSDGQPCPSRVDIMDRTCTLRPYRANNASKHCGRCLSWHHTTDKCRAAAPSCSHCSLTGHSAQEHACPLCKPGQPPVCVPECAHCKAPQPTGHPGCRARPVWDSKVNAVIVPEGERLARIQNRGRSERKLIISRLRAQAAHAARTATTQRTTSAATSA